MVEEKLGNVSCVLECDVMQCKVKVKVKIKCTLVQTLRLCTGRTAHRGSRGIALLFLDHGTRRDEGSASRPGLSLPSGMIRYPLYRRLVKPQGRSGQVRKISPPPGFDPRTVQPVTSRYTDYATRPTPCSVMPTKLHGFTSHTSVIVTSNASRFSDSVSVPRQGVGMVPGPQIRLILPSKSLEQSCLFEQEAIRLQRVLNMEGHIQPRNG